MWIVYLFIYQFIWFIYWFIDIYRVFAVDLSWVESWYIWFLKTKCFSNCSVFWIILGSPFSFVLPGEPKLGHSTEWLFSCTEKWKEKDQDISGKDSIVFIKGFRLHPRWQLQFRAGKRNNSIPEIHWNSDSSNSFKKASQSERHWRLASVFLCWGYAVWPGHPGVEGCCR